MEIVNLFSVRTKFQVFCDNVSTQGAKVLYGSDFKSFVILFQL